MGENWPILTYVRKWPCVVPRPPILPSFWVPGASLDLWWIDFYEISNLSHVEVVMKGLYLPIFGLFCPFCSLLGHFNGILSTDPQFFGLKLIICLKFCMIFARGTYISISWVFIESKLSLKGSKSCSKSLKLDLKPSSLDQRASVTSFDHFSHQMADIVMVFVDGSQKFTQLRSLHCQLLMDVTSKTSQFRR